MAAVRGSPPLGVCREIGLAVAGVLAAGLAAAAAEPRLAGRRPARRRLGLGVGRDDWQRHRRRARGGQEPARSRRSESVRARRPWPGTVRSGWPATASPRRHERGRRIRRGRRCGSPRDLRHERGRPGREVGRGGWPARSGPATATAAVSAVRFTGWPASVRAGGARCQVAGVLPEPVPRPLWLGGLAGGIGPATGEVADPLKVFVVITGPDAVPVLGPAATTATT